MKKTILFCVAALINCFAFAQKNKGTYNWGIGFKYQPAAISVKKYGTKGDAIELLLSKYDEGIRCSGLLELSPKLNKSGSLRGILGPGMHVGMWKDNIKKNAYIKNPIIGFDGIIGIECKIPHIPIAVQLDYQPSIDVVGSSEIFKDWGGLTIRFTW